MKGLTVMEENEKTPVLFYIPKKLKDALKAQAKRECCCMTALTTKALVEYLNSHRDLGLHIE